MTTDLPDTKDLSEKWCPTCQPERDPSREILSVQYCSLHAPKNDGVDDAGVIGNTSWGTHYGLMDAGGSTNRRWNELFQKGRRMSEVIGISGKIGAGKDAIANHLVSTYDFQIVRFSDELKEEVLRILRKTCEAIYENYVECGRKNYHDGDIDESDLRWMLWMDKPPIVRRLLQEWGTELRRHEQADYWILKWRWKVQSLVDQGVRVVAPDTRFLNEAEAVRYFGGQVIRVERPGLPAGDHASETESDALVFDHVIQNNGTLDELARRVNQFLFAV